MQVLHREEPATVHQDHIQLFVRILSPGNTKNRVSHCKVDRMAIHLSVLLLVLLLAWLETLVRSLLRLLLLLGLGHNQSLFLKRHLAGL